MPNFIAYLANCLIMRNKFSSDGSSSLTLNLDNKAIILVQTPQITSSTSSLHDFHGKSVHSTKILIHDVEENEVENIKTLIYSLCNVLSFITCSQVRFYGHEFPKHYSFWAIGGKTNIYHPVIEIRDGNLVREFIQSVWLKFIEFEKIRRLDMVFDYIHNANYPGSTIESKLVFSFVTLESLKHSFAEIKGYPFIGGYFRKSDKKKAFSFIELLEQMFLEVGVIFNDKGDIKNLRDELIHSGISTKDFNYNYKVFKIAQNLIREYLIRLLGWSKFYLRF